MGNTIENRVSFRAVHPGFLDAEWIIQKVLNWTFETLRDPFYSVTYLYNPRNRARTNGARARNGAPRWQYAIRRS